MRILACDATARHCSVALVASHGVLGEVSEADPETHSRHLMARIDQVLSDCGIGLSDLDGFAVAHGPGSFTGLRIAVSTVKGLAVAVGRPVATVSSLDALAFQAPCSGCLICPVLDARKGEVYFSRCRVKKGRLYREMKERVGPPEALVAGIHTPCLFIGEGALKYKEAIQEALGGLARFPGPEDHAIRASAVGRLGLERFGKDRAMDPDGVLPVYIRQADVRTPRVEGAFKGKSVKKG